MDSYFKHTTKVVLVLWIVVSFSATFNPWFLVLSGILEATYEGLKYLNETHE